MSKPKSTKPRTPAQIIADYRKTRPNEVNEWRCELIDKEYSGGLTDAERFELAECTKVMDEWQSQSPWGIAMREEMERDRREIERLKALLATQ